MYCVFTVVQWQLTTCSRTIMKRNLLKGKDTPVFSLGILKSSLFRRWTADQKKLVLGSHGPQQLHVKKQQHKNTRVNVIHTIYVAPNFHDIIFS